MTQGVFVHFINQTMCLLKIYIEKGGKRKKMVKYQSWITQYKKFIDIHFFKNIPQNIK